MGIGFDCGTYNLVCCTRDKKDDFLYKREVNAYLKLALEDRFVFNMMKNANVPLIERPDMAFALGEAAIKMAYTMSNLELKRPMSDGCLNPKEKESYDILAIMIHALLSNVKKDKEILYYSVPANALNIQTDADWHSKVLLSIFKAFKNEEGFTVDPRPINEGLALVYAELEKKMFTGIGISCLCPGTKIYTENGMVNIESVKEGEKVLTHLGRWQPIQKVITKKFKGKATKFTVCEWLYKFVDNHEIYVYRDDKWQWLGCDYLKEGDIVGEPFTFNELKYKGNFIKDNMCCGRVNNLSQEDYEGTVYDLQVEEDHSFSGPMLTIHNCGSGMVNLCFAVYGVPAFQFAIVNAGDWIDKQAAKATGESSTFINKEKTKIDLSKPPTSIVERAIQTQYQIMVEKTINTIKTGLSDSSKAARLDNPIDIVVSGGTSSPNGFTELFKDVIVQAKLPLNIGDIVRPNDPLFSVARGCLLAAEAANK